MTCSGNARVVRALTCLGVACLLSSCGSSSAQTSMEPPGIDAKAAKRLAAQARVVEARLRAGDGCGAAAAAGTLQRQAARAVTAGSVSPALGMELRQSIDALAGHISCTPEKTLDEPASFEPEAAQKEPKDGKAPKGKNGRKNDRKHRGHGHDEGEH